MEKSFSINALSRPLRKIGRRLFGKPRDHRGPAKAAAREAAFRSDAWQRDNAFAKRVYGSYDEYVTHQSSKLDRIHDRLTGRESEDLASFISRFKACAPLQEARSVLCLGARLGTEVSALHALGHFAVGIDLNPGEANRYVLPGDFHAIQFPDQSLDAVYTNSLDHAFELEKVVAEVWRVLRPRGLFIVDVVSGFEEGMVPGSYEALHWASADALLNRICMIRGFTRTAHREFPSGKWIWVQEALRKTA